MLPASFRYAFRTEDYGGVPQKPSSSWAGFIIPDDKKQLLRILMPIDDPEYRHDHSITGEHGINSQVITRVTINRVGHEFMVADLCAIPAKDVKAAVENGDEFITTRGCHMWVQDFTPTCAAKYYLDRRRNSIVISKIEVEMEHTAYIKYLRCLKTAISMTELDGYIASVDKIIGE